MMKLSENICKITHEIIRSQEFRDLARNSPTFFTRDRKMPFEDLIMFMLFHLKSSIPTALRRYFQARNLNTTMSQQSLSEACKKLTVDAFRHLYRASTDEIVKRRTQKWNGYRIYAIDGTKIALPDDKKLLNHFGGLGKGATRGNAYETSLTPTTKRA